MIGRNSSPKNSNPLLRQPIGIVSDSGTATPEATPTAAADAGAARPGPGSAAEPADELAKLREIVFGADLREFRAEVARLHHRLSLEIAKVRDELSASDRRLDGRITELDARSSQRDHELRDQLRSQSNVLADAIQERNEQTMDAVNRGLAEIRTSKVDRSALSAMLITLSKQVSGESK